MALSAALLAEIAKPIGSLDVWVEVEGVPYAFGLSSRAASWFAARDREVRRLGTLPLLFGPPDGIEQEARPFDADSSVGQMSVEVQDDGAGLVRGMYAGVARRDGWARLDTILAAPALPSPAGTTEDIVITASTFANLGALTAGALLYCGRETWEYVSTPAANTARVYRGMYRPSAPIERYAYEHTAGDVVTRYPRFLATRRMYIYAAPLGGTDADKVLRWAGTIRNAKVSASGALELTAESIESDLKAKCFAGQIRGKLVVGVAMPDGTYETGQEGEAAALEMRIRLEPASVSGRAWTDGDRVVVRVGDEVISGRLRGPASSFPNEIHFDDAFTYPLDARGLFGTTPDEHHPGDEVVEVIPVVGYNANGSLEERVSKFARGDNPLDVVLQFLLSRKGDGTNGTYDVLPAGWGLGVDQSRIDVAGVKALRDRWLPFAREQRFVEEPFIAKELLASVLKTHLCYPVSVLGDVLSVRFLGPPMPDVATREITGTHVTNAPEWLSGIDSVIGRVIVRCDLDPFEGEARQTFKGELQGPGVEAQEFYAGLFETLEVEAPGQWSGNDPGSARWGARLCTDAETVALRIIDVVRDRLARPFPHFDLECQYDALDVVVGELLRVTVAGVPDVVTGAASLVGALCEVRRTVPDERRGRVTLTVVQTAFMEQHRLIAPSALLTAGGTASSFALAAHEFGDAAGVDDGSRFPVGAVIAIWSPDLVTLRAAGRVVTGYAGGALSFSGGAVTAVAGDVVVLDAYATQPAAVKALFAFLADASSLLGTDPAHEYTP